MAYRSLAWDADPSKIAGELLLPLIEEVEDRAENDKDEPDGGGQEQDKGLGYVLLLASSACPADRPATLTLALSTLAAVALLSSLAALNCLAVATAIQRGLCQILLLCKAFSNKVALLWGL